MLFDKQSHLHGLNLLVLQPISDHFVLFLTEAYLNFEAIKLFVEAKYELIRIEEFYVALNFTLLCG